MLDLFRLKDINQTFFTGIFKQKEWVYMDNLDCSLEVVSHIVYFKDKYSKEVLYWRICLQTFPRAGGKKYFKNISP